MTNVYLFSFLSWCSSSTKLRACLSRSLAKLKNNPILINTLSFNVQNSTDTRKTRSIESRLKKKYSKRFAFRQRNWRNEMPRWIDSRYDQERNFLFFISLLLLIRKQNSDCFIAQQLFGPYELSSVQTATALPKFKSEIRIFSLESSHVLVWWRIIGRLSNYLAMTSNETWLHLGLCRGFKACWFFIKWSQFTFKASHPFNALNKNKIYGVISKRVFVTFNCFPFSSSPFHPI